MENSLKFTEAEEKIRNMWFYVCQVFPVTLIFLIFLFFHDLFDPTVLFFNIVFLIITYKCAYSKPGTAWLFFYMICLAASFVLCLFSTTTFPEKVIGVIYTVIQFYLCYKLRCINKNMKLRMVLETPVYQKAVRVFSAATSLSDLNKLYFQ